MEQLPALAATDVLLTGEDWLAALSVTAKAALQQKAAGAAGWIALQGHATTVQSQLACLRAGVGHWLAQPLQAAHLYALIESMHERVFGPAPRIFLVDNDPTSRTRLAGILRQAGWQAVEFENPFKALESAASLEPEVLIVKADMPDCSGTELATLIRLNPRTACLPTVYLSEPDDLQTPLLARRAAAQDCLTLPVNPDLLVTVVRTHALHDRAQKRAASLQQEALRQVQIELSDLRYALDEIAIVNWVNTKGIIVDANERFCTTSGYAAEELIGQSVKLLRSDTHPVALYEHIWDTISKGDIWRGEMCNRRKDGSLYWLDGAVIPLMNENGEPKSYISVRVDITKLKDQEQELRLAQEMLKKSQSFANIGSWHWDVQKEQLYWSEQVMAIMGLPGEAKLFNDFQEVTERIHPDDRVRVYQAAEAAIQDNQPYDCEYRTIRPDGTVHWIQTKGAVTRDELGRPVQFLGVIQDIHERKVAQLALAESEQRVADFGRMLQIVLDNIPVRVFWKGTDLRYAGCNKSFAKDAGYATPEKLIGLTDLSMPWVHKAQTYRSEELAIMRDRQPKMNSEEFHIDKNGEVVWLNTSKVPLINSQDELVGILGMYSDVTENVKAQAQIKESQERLTFAVEGAGDGIWDWNVKTGKMIFSGHYESMLGFEKGELDTRMSAAKEQVHPDDFAMASTALTNYLTGKSSSYSVEMRLRCKNGDYKWVLSRGTVVARDEQGNPTRLIGVRSDISDRKRTEMELVNAREAAERANQAKSDFLSSMSHELRTPLNAILGFGQILEYDDYINEDQRDNVHEILKAGHHLLHLINEVLDLAKVESGKIDLSLEPVELMPVLEDCLRLIQPLAAARNIQLNFPASCRSVVRVDRTRFKQVLLNLLSNAVKYNRLGGEITLKVLNGERVRISICDTGYGVEEHRLPELFRPFNRLAAEGSEIEGTGIGLTITRRLIEVMGGAIGVSSVVNEGTTFWVDLTPDTLDRHEATHVNEAQSIANQPSVRHKVLCIDDNPTNLKLIAQLLSRRPNLNLITAHTPSLGIELALSHKPEMILLDINMPGMNGYQVLEILKKESSLKEACVIAVTANAMPRDIERGKVAGFVDYITKPLDAAEFLKTIDLRLEGLQKEKP